METVGSVAALRAQLWDSGFRPVAICNWDNPTVDPQSRGKRPLSSGWEIQARLTPPRAAVAHPTQDQLNTGILADGLRAIDIDIDDAELASQIRALIFDTLGDAPARYRENSGRSLLLYRAATGTPVKRVLAGRLGKIEVLGHGQQFVAFGRHQSGADLYWYPDPPGIEVADTLPPITEEQVSNVLAAIAPLIGAEPGHPGERRPANGQDHQTAPASPWPSSLAADDPLLLVAALQAIPNRADAPANWDAWNSRGMALWAATQGSQLGRAAWHQWSARHPSYDPAGCDERWQHYFRSPPTLIGAGSVYHDAEAEGWQRPVPRLLRAQGKENHESYSDQNILPVEMFKDVAISTDVSDFVEGLLVSAAMSVVYGESNSGKTFFATDLGLHIAQGINWNDLDVEPGGVLYLALEGAHGIRHRIAAFREYHKLAGQNLPFAIVPVALNLLDPKADIGKLIATIHHVAATLAVPLRLVVVDTLSRAMAGGNENAPDDMGALVTNGSRIQQETGAAVMWVHHSGKDQARGARGHSLLRAATDTEIEISVSSEGPQRLAKVTKQRELECSGEFFFQLKVVELGTNQRGKPITSCIVEFGKPAVGGEAAGAARGLAGHSKRAYDVLVDLCAGSGASGYGGTPSGVLSVPEDWWRDRFYDRAMPGEKNDTKLKAFRRATEKLINQHLVGMASKRVWIVQKYDLSVHNVSDGENYDE